MIDKYTFDPAPTILGVIITVALLSFALGLFTGMYNGDKDFKKTAVKVGVAKWVSDQEGNAEFQWIINGENK
jgi:hypothetical protein